MSYKKFIQSWKELETFVDELLYFDYSRVFRQVDRVPTWIEVVPELNVAHVICTSEDATQTVRGGEQAYENGLRQ